MHFVFFNAFVCQCILFVLIVQARDVFACDF